MLKPSRNRRKSAWLMPSTLLCALRARFGMLLLAASVVFACTAALMYTLPKRYESRMEVLSGAAAKPSAATRVDTTELSSEIDLLRSTQLLTAVVLRTGLQKLEPGDSALSETSPLTIEKAVRRLKANLNVTPIKGGNLIRITYSGPSSGLAHDVLKALAATYMQRRTDAHLHRQSSKWKNLLSRAESELPLDKVAVIYGPTLPVAPSTPRLIPDLLISLAIAFAAGVAIVFLVELFTPGHIRSYAALRSYTAGMN